MCILNYRARLGLAGSGLVLPKLGPKITKLGKLCTILAPGLLKKFKGRPSRACTGAKPSRVPSSNVRIDKPSPIPSISIFFFNLLAIIYLLYFRAFVLHQLGIRAESVSSPFVAPSSSIHVAASSISTIHGRHIPFLTSPNLIIIFYRKPKSIIRNQTQQQCPPDSSTKIKALTFIFSQPLNPHHH